MKAVSLPDGSFRVERYGKATAEELIYLSQARQESIELNGYEAVGFAYVEAPWQKAAKKRRQKMALKTFRASVYEKWIGKTVKES